jgi:hypothetical protein
LTILRKIYDEKAKNKEFKVSDAKELDDILKDHLKKDTIQIDEYMSVIYFMVSNPVSQPTLEYLFQRIYDKIRDCDFQTIALSLHLLRKLKDSDKRE